MGGDYLLISYQFGITPVVQYKVLWFQVSVDDTFGMQISKGLHHAGCVKSGGWVFERSPGNTAGQPSGTVNKMRDDAERQWI